MAKKTESLCEVRSSIYFPRSQHDTLQLIIAENKLENLKNPKRKRKPDTLAEMVRGALDKQFIQPYLKKVGRETKKG